MKLSDQAINEFRNYIMKNDVVYQRYGELMEVSNDGEESNRTSLLKDLDNACCVEIYHKSDKFITEDFHDIDAWSKDDDVLFLIEAIGTLVCIPKKIAIKHSMIEE